MVYTSKIGTRTPWGVADNHEELAEGIDCFSTPGHGGIKLDRRRNAAVPAVFRRPGGWYEEDCEWAIPAYFHPDGWKDKEGIQDIAVQNLKDWFWEAWEAHSGEVLPPGASHQKDKHLFREENKDKFKVISAYGSWADWVTDGFVGVCARIDDRLTFASSAEVEAHKKNPLAASAYFLVPNAEYEARGKHGFVIDEARHQRVTGPQKD